MTPDDPIFAVQEPAPAPGTRYADRVIRGRGLYRTLMIWPYAVAPAIAGMLKMPLRQYGPASLVSAVVWSATFLAPGWVFGTSLDLVAAVDPSLRVRVIGKPAPV